MKNQKQVIHQCKKFSIMMVFLALLFFFGAQRYESMFFSFGLMVLTLIHMFYLVLVHYLIKINQLSFQIFQQKKIAELILASIAVFVTVLAFRTEGLDGNLFLMLVNSVLLFFIRLVFLMTKSDPQ